MEDLLSRVYEPPGAPCSRSNWARVKALRRGITPAGTRRADLLERRRANGTRRECAGSERRADAQRRLRVPAGVAEERAAPSGCRRVGNAGSQGDVDHCAGRVSVSVCDHRSPGRRRTRHASSSGAGHSTGSASTDLRARRSCRHRLESRATRGPDLHSRQIHRLRRSRDHRWPGHWPKRASAGLDWPVEDVLKRTMAQLGDLLGESPPIAALRDQVRRLVDREAPARRQPPVLIRGETGTGKGLLAQAIHHASSRGRGPFVPINCASVSGTLLEAELFGVEAGAFTDARQRKPGLFQTAHRGTLFLDEVGALAHDLQAKLLTAIEDRVVRRVGGVRGEAVDVWVLSATSADLDAAMAAERFRPDLYHRLATISLWLPPLRERGGDVAQLAGVFLARACSDYGRPQKTLTPEALAAIAGHRWPGNVRELANVMERVALMSDAPEIQSADLGLGDSPEAPAASSGDTAVAMSSFTDSLSRFERAQLIAALDAAGWNVVRAARQLGLPRTTLRHRMAKHRLARGGALHPAEASTDTRGDAQPLAPRPAVFQEERTVALLQTSLEGIDPSSIEVLIEKVEGFGGKLVEVASTGFLAAFGVAPVEDAPSHAARAALAVRNALVQDARDRASWP